MRMWVLLFGRAAGMPPVTHTDALFAEQSQSILDDLVALGVGLFGPLAVICGGHIGIEMLAHFALQFATRRMHGLEIARWNLCRTDGTSLVNLMSASTGVLTRPSGKTGRSLTQSRLPTH